MLNNLKASEKRRLMQFQMDISQLRNWKKDVADEALLEVEALTNLLHAPDDLQVARCVTEMILDTETRILSVGELDSALPMTKSADGVLVYRGTADTDLQLSLDICCLESNIEHLDLLTPREQAQNNKSWSDVPAVTLAGKFTPKDRSRLEVAAESLQQVSREREKYRDQLELLQVQYQQALAELSQAECGSRAAATTVLEDSVAKNLRMEKALTIANAE